MNKEVKTLDSIIKAYSKKKITNKRKREKIYIAIIKTEAKIKALKEKYSNLTIEYEDTKSPEWSKEILEPLAKELMKRSKMKSYEIIGPIGTRSSYTIHLYKDIKIGNYNEDYNLCITITSKNLNTGELHYDTGYITRPYAKGISKINNNLIYETEKLPNNIDDIVKLLKEYNSDMYIQLEYNKI